MGFFPLKWSKSTLSVSKNAGLFPLEWPKRRYLRGVLFRSWPMGMWVGLAA